jgi:hypothetical protein
VRRARSVPSHIPRAGHSLAEHPRFLMKPDSRLTPDPSGPWRNVLSPTSISFIAAATVVVACWRTADDV